MKGRLGLILLLVAVAGPPCLRADYRENYKKGVQAADRNDWSEVSRWMQEAVREQPKDTGEPVRISGVFSSPYLPHFYLGLARYAARDCEGALDQWKLSESHGAIQGRQRWKEYGLLQKYRNECKTRLAALRPAEESLPPAPTPAASPAGEVRAEIQAAETPRARVEEPAEKKEETARNPEPAAPAEDQAALRARVVEEKRKAMRQEVARVADDAAAILAGAATQKGRDVKRQRSRLEELLDRAKSPGPEVDLAALRKEISAATTALEAALLAASGEEGGPPLELLSAARALFRASYQDVVDTLAGASFAEGRAEVARHLLLAASRYALFVRGGGKDEKLRQQAVEDVRACRRLNPKLAPDPRSFSPRFIQFFQAGA